LWAKAGCEPKATMATRAALGYYNRSAQEFERLAAAC
jgi:hypothetical protein